MSSCLKRKLAEEKRRAAWTVQNQFQAVRTDGVVATGLHGHGDYPFVVIRPLPKPRKEYGRTIYDLAIRRELIQVGMDLHNRAFDAPVDDTPARQILDAEQALYQLAERGKYEGGFRSFHESLKVAIDMAAAAYERDGGLSGISTGLNDLDHRLGGLQTSDLIILAGRPSMGKTALATNIAFNAAKAYKAEHHADGTVAVKDGAIVGFFSLEMSSEQLATRLLAEQSGVPSERIRRGNIHESQFSKLVDTSNLMAQVPLYIDDTGGISVAQLAARAREHVRAGKPRFPVERAHGLEIAQVFFAASRSGEIGRLGAMLAEDVSLYSDGGGKRPAAARVMLGWGEVTRTFAAIARLTHGRTGELIRYAYVNGLPGFVTREPDGILQTTALLIENDRVRAIYVMRNPDKLRHLEGRLN